MDIKGWVRTSLIDYPEHIASVIFTGGCNFRCPMCHNADLVLHPEEVENISEQNVLSFLQQTRGFDRWLGGQWWGADTAKGFDSHFL